MEKKVRVFEVQQTYERIEIDSTERIIFEFDEEKQEWNYKSPNAQKHNVKQIKVILDKLIELNKEQ